MAIIKLGLGTGVSGTLPDGNAPSGSVLQVKSTFNDNTQTTTSTSFVDVTGMSQTITPTSTSNKILIHLSFCSGCQPSSQPYFRLMRGSTHIAVTDYLATDVTFTVPNPQSPDTDRGYAEMGFQFLDSPATTSATTYKLTMATSNGSYTAYFGRRDLDDNRTHGNTLTLMEIAG